MSLLSKKSMGVVVVDQVGKKLGMANAQSFFFFFYEK